MPKDLMARRPAMIAKQWQCSMPQSKKIRITRNHVYIIAANKNSWVKSLRQTDAEIVREGYGSAGDPIPTTIN